MISITEGGYLTCSFNALPALKRTTRRLGILMNATVWGLRAVRALRSAVLKVPKQTKVIASPFLSDFVMPSINESTAAAAPALDEPVSFAIFAIKSCLFIEISSPSAHEQRPSRARRPWLAVIRDAQRSVNQTLRGFFLGDPLECFVERLVFRWRCGTELDIRLIDFDVGCEATLVDAFVLRREIASR